MNTGMIVNLLLALLAGANGQGIAASFVFTNGQTVQESAGVFQACVALNEALSTGSITITVATQAAVNTERGINFGNPTPQALTFTPTASQLCFSIPIIRDNIVQLGVQLFALSLSSTDINVQLSMQQFVTIEESDVLVVALSSLSYTVQEGMPIQICADVVNGILASGSSLTATVTSQTGTASAGSDFVAIVSQLVFTSEVVAPVCRPVSTIDDSSIEALESFTVTLEPLAGAINLEVVNGTGIVYIVDNDVATLGFQETAIMVDEGNFNMSMQLEVCVELILEAGQELERLVNGSAITVANTASAGQDFLPLTQSLSFDSTNRNGDLFCFEVTIIGDDTIEQNETFRIKLTSSTEDTVDPKEVTITLIHDGDVNVCPMLPNISNGQVTITGFGLRETATYTCNTNFTLVEGAITRECQSSEASGLWSGNEPRCVPMCPIFMIEQGTIQITGDSATAECYDGYEVSMGDVVRYCQQNYTWSGTEPQCTLVDCGTLPDVMNGIVTHEDTVYQSTAMYMCNSGFTLTDGNSQRTCDINGDWTGEEPTCNGALKTVVPSGVVMTLLTVLMATLLANL
ncbi:uncharacterized protein LOC135343969 [Halichondria panicea]|uniref:uncharacterized protein LOC135343969 n=1 Tax=Halichondria panicea TaxID=6063 RepID=UPI00312B9EF0